LIAYTCSISNFKQTVKKQKFCQLKVNGVRNVLVGMNIG